MTAQRAFFFLVAIFILLGIYVSPWIHYLLAAGMVFAGITGICPSMTLFKKMGLK